MRKFEKVSFEQYIKDLVSDLSIDEIRQEYDDIKLPKRATKKSAGFDFFSPCSFQLEPNETIKIPTGIRAFMEEYNMLKIYVRSSVGFKYDVVLSNGTGIIDCDYVNSENEGHIWIKFINHGKKTWDVKKGDAISQGIFEDFDIVDDEEEITAERIGGIGSTSDNK